MRRCFLELYFKNYYASILASNDFKIPNKSGKEIKLKELYTKNKLKTGFYRVKINTDDKNIKKLIAFSKNNVYTSIDLKFIMELQETIKINIELIQDNEPNAYIYNLDTLENGFKVFNNWYDAILKLKKEMPKNILLKMLSSSLWGHLSRNNKITVSEDEAYELNEKHKDRYSVYEIITTKTDETFYQLLDNEKPYFYNLRLKPFVTAFGRVKTAKVVLLNLNKVIRIHTDGIVFSEEQTFNIENLIKEDKTTGKIEFFNINRYTKI